MALVIRRTKGQWVYIFDRIGNAITIRCDLDYSESIERIRLSFHADKRRLFRIIQPKLGEPENASETIASRVFFRTPGQWLFLDDESGNRVEILCTTQWYDSEKSIRLEFHKDQERLFRIVRPTRRYEHCETKESPR